VKNVPLCRYGDPGSVEEARARLTAEGIEVAVNPVPYGGWGRVHYELCVRPDREADARRVLEGEPIVPPAAFRTPEIEAWSRRADDRSEERRRRRARRSPVKVAAVGLCMPVAVAIAWYLFERLT
jgi:hypothetical protein